MEQKSCKKLQIEFVCLICDYKTYRKSSFNKHNLSSKHIYRQNFNILEQKSCKELYTCNKCNKIYTARNSYWYHNKKCKENIIKTDDNTSIKELSSMFIELLKSNNELQKQMIDVCKNNNTTNNTINNNSHNKTFNLQFFLNEQCKDAMNMSDFIKSFDLQLSDLETVGELGYIDGTTKIFLEKINKMDVYKRPIHCSDAKREIIYVKDENVWTKEEKDYPKLRKAIKVISFNNMKLVYNWSMANPDSLDNETKLNDTYIKLVFETSGGKGLIIDSENKIIRRIVKEIVIDKNIFL